jgi:hypothetical protein
MKPETVPAGYDQSEAAVTLPGISEGQILTEINWDMITAGGHVWVTAMLPSDSTRIYRRIEVAFINIGLAYSSPSTYTGKFKIVNGLVTINDIYDVIGENYRLSATLTSLTLPDHIQTGLGSGTVPIPVHNWAFVMTAAELDMISYAGMTRMLLATALVVGQTIELYLVVNPCVVVGVIYETDVDASRNFQTDPSKVFNFDAYKNFGYNGVFTLPGTIKFVYSSAYVRTNPNTSYYALYNGDYNLNLTGAPIAYDLSGHRLALQSGSDINLAIKFPDGQIFTFKIHFYNKTVTGAVAHDFGDFNVEGQPTVDGTYNIDPYGDRNLPSSIIVKFVEGSDYIYNGPSWSLPSDYEVKYDTYRRLLSSRDPKAFYVTANLAFQGLPAQSPGLNVQIVDRVMDSWKLFDDKNPSNTAPSDYYAGDIGNPNNFYVYLDPFAGRASELPASVKYADVLKPARTTDIYTIAIDWGFNDSNISASGTVTPDPYGRYGMVIRGYIGSSAYGQQISIRVFVDAWRYNSIKKYVGAGSPYQIMSQEIKFMFSPLDDRTSVPSYEIVFDGSRFNYDKDNHPFVMPTAYTVSSVTKVFYPEDTGVTVPAANLNYRIYWNQDAKERARGLLAIGQAFGPTVFYLGNAAGQIKITPAPVAGVYYQYENSVVSKLSFDPDIYAFASTNQAVLVVDPLRPVYPSKARARGTRNGEYDVDFPSEVTVIWPSAISVDSYLGGGVYRGYTVSLDIAEGLPRQDFNIIVVFLDMSPTSSLTKHNGNDVPHSLTADFKIYYDQDTYLGKFNPYRESYDASLIAAINMTIYKLGYYQDGRHTLNYDQIVWETAIPNTVARETAFYSASVVVGGVRYQTNIIKLICLP